MRLFHRKQRYPGLPLESDSASRPGLDAVDYDTQTDLALPTNEVNEPGAAMTPFAGELNDVEQSPGYDVGRDVAD